MPQQTRNKTVVGLTERILLRGAAGEKSLLARIDTGANQSSVDACLAESIGLGIPCKSATIRTSEGESVRDVVRGEMMIGGRKMLVFFSVANRRAMKYKVLIGQNVLRHGFLIDASRGAV